MGQMAILNMSFLTFPVAHNSVWESVFGVPFDRCDQIPTKALSCMNKADHLYSIRLIIECTLYLL
jgi:hypothetical protein